LIGLLVPAWSVLDSDENRGITAVHSWLSALLTWYFAILGKFGIPGVAVMTALAVPSEVVIPPAAYVVVYKHGGNVGAACLWAVLVIVAGALGYTASAILCYWAARGIGRPLIVRYGKYLLLPEKKLKLGEDWVARYGAVGIMLGALLPGVRHLACVPAGMMGMRFRTFTLMAFTGSAIWCAILVVFGLLMSRDMAAMVQLGSSREPAGYQHACANLIYGTTTLIVVVAILYFLLLKNNAHREQKDRSNPSTTT